MTALSTNTSQTMSSREIAETIEVRHDSAKRTMDRLAERGVISITPVVEPTKGGGKPTTVYRVNQRDSYVVAAQLSPEMTARLVDRWQELESGQAQPVAAEPRSLALETMQDSLKIGELLGLPTHYAQIEAVKQTKEVSGQDYSGMLAYAPAQDNIPADEVMLEPSALAPHFDLTPAQMNNRLRDAGLQTKSHGQWVPTIAGNNLCATHSWSTKYKSGYNQKWNLSAVRELLEGE